jgi:thioredoxin-related protein
MTHVISDWTVPIIVGEAPNIPLGDGSSRDQSNWAADAPTRLFPMIPIVRNCFLALTLLLFFSSQVPADAPQPATVRPRTLFVQTSVEQAWKLAVTAKKPLLVMFTSENCMYCQKMLNVTYSHPAIERMLTQSTETVLAHSRDYKDLAKKLGVRGYPCTILVAPDGQVLDFMEGFVEPKVFADRIYPLLYKRTARADDASTSVAAHATER